MNAVVDPREPFVCWACERVSTGERVASGDVVLCGPCDRLEPCPVVLKSLPPASPPAPVPPTPTAEPADTAVERQEVVCLLGVARAAREASLALDTLTQRIKHALESAPPPVAAAAQLSTPLPADAPVPESAAESQADGGGADADLPPGWQRDRGHGSCFVYGSDTSVPIGAHPVAFYDESGWNKWCWQRPFGKPFNGRAESKLSAMCAALGIDLREAPPGSGHFKASLPPPLPEHRGDQYFLAYDIENAARWALTAFHARQQEAAMADDCKGLVDHAAFKPIATHPDGSPRAGCDVCGAQGAPELSARERGIDGCACPTAGVIDPRCPRCAQEFSSRLELEAKDGRAVL